MKKSTRITFAILALAIFSSFASLSFAQVTVSIDAPTQVSKGTQFTVDINVTEVKNLDTASFFLSYDDDMLQVKSVTNGDLTQGASVIVNDTEPGRIKVGINMPGLEGVSGAGSIARINFEAPLQGMKQSRGKALSSELTLSEVLLGDIEAKAIPSITTAAQQVHLKGFTAETPQATVSLTPSKGESGTLEPRYYTTEYAIDVPVGVEQLAVVTDSLNILTDIHLYVRFGQQVEYDYDNDQFIADFASETWGKGKNFEVVYINSTTTPALQSGTYYIAIANYSNYSCNYSVGGLFVQSISLTSQIPQAGAVSRWERLGHTRYTIDVPGGASELKIDLNAANLNYDIDLHARFGQPVLYDSNTQTFTADFESTSPSGNESVTIPNPQNGMYFIGIANWAEIDVEYTLTATATAAPLIEVIIAPTQATVPVNDTQQFSATVTGTENTDVTWSVNDIPGGNTTFGTISGTGLYTAPASVPSPNAVTVKATSVADPTKSDTATVTITEEVTTVEVSVHAPSEAPAGANFTAEVRVIEVQLLDTAFFRLIFDADVIDYQTATLGDWLPQNTSLVVNDEVTGELTVVLNLEDVAGASGAGALVEFEFSAIGSVDSQTDICVSDVLLGDKDAKEIPSEVVTPCAPVTIGQPSERVLVSISAPTEVAKESVFTVTVDVTQVGDLDTVFFRLNFDAEVISYQNAEKGNWLPGLTSLTVNNTVEDRLTVVLNLDNVTGVSGAGTLVEFEFSAIGSVDSQTDICISDVLLGDKNAKEIPSEVVTQCASVTIGQPSERVLVSISAPAEVAKESVFTVTVDVTQVGDLDTVFFRLNFDAEVISYQNAEKGNWLPGLTSLIVNDTVEDRLTVVLNLDNVTGVSGAGTLVEFEFSANSSGGSASLSVVDAACVPTTSLSLSDVLLGDKNAHEIPSDTASPVSMQIGIMGDVNENGEITPFDAALVLQYLVGLITLSDEQQCLADVTHNGTISALDAAFILQRNVGLITEFPNSAPIVAGVTSSHKLSLPTISAKTGDKVIIPLKINNGRDIFAGVLQFHIDGNLKLVDVHSGEKTADYTFVHNVSDGQMTIAFAGVTASSETDTLLNLECEISPQAESRKTQSLTLIRGILNEESIVRETTAIVELLPTKTALLSNYPNPFNPETWIPFKLANSAEVTIHIYSTKGQIVRTLRLGNQRAGIYVAKDKAAYWDGKNNFNENVASGVYFYTLQIRESIPDIGVGDFRATRRMVIMK